MKLIACLLVVALCAYIGRLLSRRATQRLDFFREFQSSMICLTDRITGMNLELYKALEAPRDSALGGFFRSCSRMLKDSPQKRFAGIWRNCFDGMRLSFLTKEDLKVVYAGGEAVETLCMNPSEKQAGAYIRMLGGYVGEMETDKRRKCKLYNTTGMLTGLLIALLMI
jgi:stage III sporulation protein AB